MTILWEIGHQRSCSPPDSTWAMGSAWCWQVAELALNRPLHHMGQAQGQPQSLPLCHFSLFTPHSGHLVDGSISNIPGSFAYSHLCISCFLCLECPSSPHPQTHTHSFRCFPWSFSGYMFLLTLPTTQAELVSVSAVFPSHFVNPSTKCGILCDLVSSIISAQ